MRSWWDAFREVMGPAVATVTFLAFVALVIGVWLLLTHVFGIGGDDHTCPYNVNAPSVHQGC